MGKQAMMNAGPIGCRARAGLGQVPAAPRRLIAELKPASLLAAGLLFGAPFMLAAPVAAGPFQDAAGQAETRAATGDAVGAYDAARKAFEDFAAGLPFSIGKALFVSEKPSAYGAYAPRSNSVFRPGEPLITYVELIGLTWKPVEGGKQQSVFTVDLELKDDKGATLAAQKSFGSFTFTGYARNQEIYTHLTLDVTGATAGNFVLTYTVNDVYGQRSAAFEQKFSVSAN
jgi:hypothetical protein